MNWGGKVKGEQVDEMWITIKPTREASSVFLSEGISAQLDGISELEVLESLKFNPQEQGDGLDSVYICSKRWKYGRWRSKERKAG